MMLESIELKPVAAAHPPITGGGPPPAAESKGRPQWKVPAGWRETAPSTMALARFLIGEEGKAELTVTVLPGPAGGIAANVNRWRGQLGLAGWDEAELASQLQPLDGAGAGAMLVEMTGTDARGGGEPMGLLGAIVPRGNQTWFFKLTGQPAVVIGQKNAFVEFLSSINYSDGI